MRVLALSILGCILAATAAFGDTFSTTAYGPIGFWGDQLTLTGETGIITLGPGTTTAEINSAQSTRNYTGLDTYSEMITISFDLTLDGVTETLSQTGTWTVSPTADSFTANPSAAPVLFDLGPNGAYDVTLDAWGYSGGVATGYQTPVLADFTAVPEPASIGILAIGLLALGIAGKRRRAGANV